MKPTKVSFCRRL